MCVDGVVIHNSRLQNFLNLKIFIPQCLSKTKASNGDNIPSVTYACSVCRVRLYNSVFDMCMIIGSVDYLVIRSIYDDFFDSCINNRSHKSVCVVIFVTC